MISEKIEQFVEQCREKKFHPSESGPEEYEGFNYEKFAQLVAEDCVELIRLQYVGEQVLGHEYRNRGLAAAEFVVCEEYDLKMQKQPKEKFY